MIDKPRVIRDSGAIPTVESQSPFKPLRYAVYYTYSHGPHEPPTLGSTHRTKLGALIDYHAAPLAATRKWIVDYGKDWRKRGNLRG